MDISYIIPPVSQHVVTDFPIKSIEVCISKFSLQMSIRTRLWASISEHSTSCGQCGQNTSVPGQGKPKECSKCRIVTYCGVECQTAHWQTHKTECKETYAFMRSKLLKYHASGEWEKVLKYGRSIRGLIGVLHEKAGQDESKANTSTLAIFKIFVTAFRAALIFDQSERRGDHAMSLCCMLENCIAVQGKMPDHEATGRSMCELADTIQLVPFELLPKGDDAFDVELFLKAAQSIGRTYDVPALVAHSSVSLGQRAIECEEIDRADILFKEALLADQKISGEREVVCRLALADICILKKNFVYAGGWISGACRLLSGYDVFSPLHLACQLQITRINEAEGKTKQTEKDVRKFVRIIREDIDDVNKWPPMVLQGIIVHAMANLSALDKSGKVYLKLMFEKLAFDTHVQLNMDDIANAKNKLLKIRYI
jgi:hypothetical protein